MNLHVTTHTTLLHRLRQADHSDAWREFCDRYGDLIQSYARRRGVRPSDTDDVLQDALIELTRALPTFEYDPQRGKFRNFLKTIVERTIFRRFRQNPALGRQLPLEQVSEPGDSDPGAESVWEDEWQQHHVRLAMKTIEIEFGLQDRAAFQAYVIAGESPETVAARLSLTVNQIYKAKSNILRRLAELVEAQVREEG